MSRLTTTVFVEIRSFPSSVFVISAIFVRILHPIPKNRKYRLSPRSAGLPYLALVKHDKK